MGSFPPRRRQVFLTAGRAAAGGLGCGRGGRKWATARVSPMVLAAVELVRKAMTNPNPLACRTGIPPCGKPTTGVTVRPWTGIFMLHGPSSPESYFQAAFRVQSP